MGGAVHLDTIDARFKFDLAVGDRDDQRARYLLQFEVPVPPGVSRPARCKCLKFVMSMLSGWLLIKWASSIVHSAIFERDRHLAGSLPDCAFGSKKSSLAAADVVRSRNLPH